MYPSIAPIVSFDNDYHKFFKNIIIKETKKNPNFVLCKMLSEKEYSIKFKNSKKKLTTAEDIYKMNQWFSFFRTKFFFDKKLNNFFKIKKIN